MSEGGNGTCIVDGCGEKSRTKTQALCSRHYQRLLRNGDPVNVPVRAPRPVEIARPTCSVDGCEKPVRTKKSGLCTAHDHRLRRHGDPLRGTAGTGEPLAFAAAALASETDECILWPFGKDGHGYGRMTVDGRPVTVSRWVCENINGPPPSGRRSDARHTCGNGHLGCITKKHLQWGTRQQNCNDTVAQGRTTRGSKNAAAKLTEAEVRAIRSLRGVLCERELGDRFGISAAQAGNILRRKAWAWLPDDPPPQPVANHPSTRV
jgi:hypothetical protein